jgi:hypothetical protein
MGSTTIRRDSVSKREPSWFGRWSIFSLFDRRSRPAWHRPFFAFTVTLSLGTLSLPAAGQDRLDARSKSYDYTFGGVQYRVPGSYMRPSINPRHADDHLYFAFWVSDGKPIADGVPPLGSNERRGRAYWPPEPDRPSFSSKDFVVFVMEAVPMDPSQGLTRQRWPRERVGGSEGLITREYGLECRSYPTGSKHCFTSLGDDPDVSMSLAIWGPDNTVWDMKFYSKVDAVWVKLSFPGLGQSRWPDVVCRTLQLVRSWRVGDGPQPPDCSQSPRLSSGGGKESPPSLAAESVAGATYRAH